MFYLVIENLSKKRCIDKSETNLYKDDQFYNCLRYLPFEGEGKVLVCTIKIRCVADPSELIEASVYGSD
jgi:hypothetical protein